MYILFNIEADDLLTGGTFYTDQEFDSKFVDALIDVCTFVLQASCATFLSYLFAAWPQVKLHLF